MRARPTPTRLLLLALAVALTALSGCSPEEDDVTTPTLEEARDRVRDVARDLVATLDAPATVEDETLTPGEESQAADATTLSYAVTVHVRRGGADALDVVRDRLSSTGWDVDDGAVRPRGSQDGYVVGFNAFADDVTLLSIRSPVIPTPEGVDPVRAGVPFEEFELP